MATSFKSSGNKSDSNLYKGSISPQPIGIKTPLEYGNDGVSGLFKMHFSFEGQINDNFRNLLLTNFGDRLGRYDYGANLRSLLFELSVKDDFDVQAMINIKEAVDKFMPYLDLADYDSSWTKIEREGSPDAMTKVVITLRYNIAQLRIINKKIQVVLWVAG